jgi:hypothetical protein
MSLTVKEKAAINSRCKIVLVVGNFFNYVLYVPLAEINLTIYFNHSFNLWDDSISQKSWLMVFAGINFFFLITISIFSNLMLDYTLQIK